MKIKMKDDKRMADSKPHLPQRLLKKDVEYFDLSDFMAKSVLENGYGEEVKEKSEVKKVKDYDNKKIDSVENKTKKPFVIPKWRQSNEKN